MRPLVACVVGTRPEAIKMAPVVRQLERLGGVDVQVIATGQHRELLDRALGDFGLVAGVNLGLMRPGQGLAELLARALEGLAGVWERRRPAMVLAQGDTTTVLAAGLACHSLRVPLGHVEAGLRSGCREAPFPEETNRVLVARLADVHFAPTAGARGNLLAEGIDPGAVVLTGNTVVDALRSLAAEGAGGLPGWGRGRYALATIHRRENHGEPLERVARALGELVGRHPGLGLVVPLHPNPEAGARLRAALGGRERVALVEPLGYREFLGALRGAELVLTDSGGVQEEAAVLGSRVLVLRETTERPEALEEGRSCLVGTDPRAIGEAADRLLAASREVGRSGGRTAFGDGRAAERIAREVARRVGIDPGPMPAGLDAWPGPLLRGAA